MPSNKTTWILVTDAARARIFKMEGRGGNLELVHEADGAAREKGSDLLADRPGRSFDSAGQGRHAMEPHTDPKSVEKHKFAQHVSDLLVKGADQHAYAALIVVAAPRTLGELRQMLPDRVSSLVKAEIDKDWTQSSESDLMGHLEPHL